MIELMERMRQIAESAAAGIGKSTHGIVTNVDQYRGAVKVLIMPEGNESGWIKDPAYAAGNLRISCPCEQGTHVLLESIEGDAENYVVIGRYYDDVVQPPISPQTGTVAQPGELLAMTGQGIAPKDPGGTVGEPADAFAWFHLTLAGFYAGLGDGKVAIEQDAITLTKGENASFALTDSALLITFGTTTFTLNATSLAAMGATITTDQTITASVDVQGGSEPVSLVTHIHTDVVGGVGNSGPPA